jgi:hypothetical protein
MSQIKTTSLSISSWLMRLFALTLAVLLVSCGGDSPPPPWIGNKLMGAQGSGTYGNAVATDASGNVYAVGYTDGGLDGNNLTGTRDSFLIKYSSSGEKQYTKQFGVQGKDTAAWGVATDGNGNVYVAGSTDAGIDGNTLTGIWDFFLIKYNSIGEKQYTKQLGVQGKTTAAYSVATDTNGNVYVTGYTNGGLDGNSMTGTQDFFLTKYDSSGEKQFTKQLGSTGFLTQANAVATDITGNVYVTGYTNGGLDGNTKIGYQDVFLTKFSSIGEKQYTKQLGVKSVINAEVIKAVLFAEGMSVVTDKSGNVYVLGNLLAQGKDKSDGLDGNSMTGTQDFFLTKYDSSGEKQFTKQLGVQGVRTDAKSVTTDANGNVYIAGYTYGGLDGNTLTGKNDLFLTKYSSSGEKQFTKQMAGVEGKQTQAWGVTTDANGNVFVAGDTDGLAGETLTGTNDFLLVKFNSSGVKQ